MGTITAATIRSLASIRSSKAPITSCYLDVDGSRRVRPKDFARALDRLLDGASGDSSAVDPDPRDLERIRTHVRGEIDRSTVRGLAMFSCQEDGVWEVLELPVAVRDQLVVGHAPSVGQLELVLQLAEPLGVLLVDRERARIFVFELGALVERSEFIDELPRDYDDVGERSRGGPAAHRADLALQHVRHAAAAAFDMYQEHPFAHLVVGAPDELRSVVTDALHPYLQERMGPDIHCPPTAPPDEIRRHAMAAESAIEATREAAVVERLRAAAAAGNRGVAGLVLVLDALNQRRVDHLVFSTGYSEPGWRCAECGHLGTVGPKCPLCGRPMSSVDNIVAEAVDAALAGGSRVDACLDNADLDVLGRIGALLRY